MDFKRYLTEFLRHGSDWSVCPGCFFTGCRELYQVSADEREKKLLLQCLRKGAELADKGKIWEAQLPELGTTLFFLYDLTGGRRSRERLDACMAQIRTGFLSTADASGVGAELMDTKRTRQSSLLQIYPFYAEYETRYHNKEEYAAIVKSLLALCPPDDVWTDGAGWYLMIMADTIERVSMEIFEHYKALEETFKAAARNFIRQSRERMLTWEDSATAGYVVAKACSLGMLNSEKYAQTALDMIGGALGQLTGREEPEQAGIAMMVYARLLALNDIQ